MPKKAKGASRKKPAPKYLYAATSVDGAIIDGDDGDVLVRRSGTEAKERGIEELGTIAGGGKPLRYVLESSVRPGGK